MVMPVYTPALHRNNNMPRNELISRYFAQGYTNKEISQVLMAVHKISISISQIKRILRSLDLKRRKVNLPLPGIIGAIYKIIENSGQCLGYRAVWKRLTTEFGFFIPRKSVMELLRMIDPDGVTRRRKRRLIRRRYTTPGPNFVWHIDGYDKLKPFGFPIHGAIDGFSRRILWLEVGPSNNNPQIIARYFLDTVEQLGGCPQRCRCDLGTENTVIEEIQVLFHALSNYEIVRNCFLYGKSTSNQRIEAWWSILRRQNADWWINFFKDLRQSNLFNDADPLHVECIRYCFMDVLQKELNQVVIQWNQHTMQVKKNNESPGGKPDILFFVPDSCGTRDYIVNCDQNDILYCQQAYGESRPIHGCSEEFISLVNLILPNHDRPSDVNEAADLYGQLIFQLSLYDK